MAKIPLPCQIVTAAGSDPELYIWGGRCIASLRVCIWIPSLRAWRKQPVPGGVMSVDSAKRQPRAALPKKLAQTRARKAHEDAASTLSTYRQPQIE